MEKLIIRDEKLTDKAVYFLKKDLTSHPLVSKTMWSENGTQLIVQDYLGSSIDNFCFSLVLAKEDDIDVRKVMNLLTEMISRFEPKIITLETEDYALKKRYVFPDRLPIGWLMYIGHAYGEGAFDLGDRAIDVNKSGESIGTLFLSKEGLFNGEDEQDIKSANDLETLLAAHNVLPTYDEIF
ncbi:immunity 52 family protein [Candidatus Symbiopectobacterium sp. NZEC127]|uniref:immunity 52 family protein n=1 Tax=Candidatus Symbiopectobacterium sp. NZEC127 TaxID=2820472 RepID=UPI0022279C41|nr:immunity 52 family protein [Candidatus Symbiopectobacterium sp. NZEC127]MCW2485456.1 immunity 52 family protein [Candidatus Symbiopectobacterium sp. NZEC127]